MGRAYDAAHGYAARLPAVCAPTLAAQTCIGRLGGQYRVLTGRRHWPGAFPKTLAICRRTWPASDSAWHAVERPFEFALQMEVSA